MYYNIHTYTHYFCVKRGKSPGTQAGVRLMEGTSTPTVIALEAARGFLRRLREGGIWLPSQRFMYGSGVA